MAGQTQNTNNGVGGLYKRSLPTIADVVRRKIGEIIDLSAYQLRNTHSQPDNIGWFYNDKVRNKYTDYRTYIDEVYTSKNDVPVTEFTAFSTPFKTIDSMLGASDHITDMVHNNSPFQTVRELVGNRDNDTVMAMYSHEVGRHALYKTYSATKLHHNVYPGRGISRGINNTLGLVGHLNGFDIYVNPETGRSGDLDYSQRVYANYDNTVGASVNYEDLAGYFTVDSGYDTHLYAEGSELTQSTVEALRKNLYTGENVLAGESGGIGNKYRNQEGSDGKVLTYMNGRYVEENKTYVGRRSRGGVRRSNYTTSGWFYREGTGTDKDYSMLETDIGVIGVTDDRELSDEELRKIDERTSNEILLGTYESSNGFSRPSRFNSHIMAVTNAAFSRNKYKTLISRFCVEQDSDEIGTAVSRAYGISHGRNLLTLKGEKMQADSTNGYINPYCRVWTNHHEYSQYKKAIRPFDDDQVPNQKTAGEMKDWDDYRNYGGSQRLDDYSVLKLDTNTLRITPTHSDTGVYNNDVKRCMFSIENLAWKGFTKQLLPDQQGPFGGRIMWFPPYGLTFNETTNVNWSENEFIGRGEKIFTYVNSERRGNIDFKLLIDHPAIINSFRSEEDGGKMLDSDLLRFYAGCDVPEQDKPKKPEPKYSLHKPGKEELRTNPEDKKIRFFVFYPNNYSGQETGDLANDPYYPIVYLLNGVGTGEYYDGSTTRTIPLYESSDGQLIHKFTSVESFTKDGSVYSLRPDYTKSSKTVKSKSNIHLGECSGFEMRADKPVKGISLVKNSGEYDFHDLPYGSTTPLQHVMIDSNVANGYALTTKEELSGSTDSYVLAPFITQRKNTKEPKQVWFYRIDKCYRGKYGENGNKLQELIGKSNYSDNNSFGLNSNVGIGRVESKLCGSMDKSMITLVSLADMAKALMPGKTDGLDSSLYDQTNVNTITEILAKNTITKIHAKGFANIHGDKYGHRDRNIALATRRGRTVINWLKATIADLKDLDEENVLSEAIDYQQSGNEVVGVENNTNDVNTLAAKIGRGAEITLSYRLKGGEVVQAAEAEVTITDKTLEELSELLNTTFTDEASLYAWATANGYTCTKNGPTEEEEQLLKGYGNEYKFFKELKREDPTAFNKLMTKIKYFEPAYHSISPEGFVERLNFINQCTRQGATNTGSGNAANNLAFGRPPVCVLRIGDFFYTKILITGINIEYSEATWDMNPEGAGVQPMYADVNISFIFQGGSDITGPVSRLQDAMSFNYYANMGITSPYAERMIRNDETKEVTGIIASPLKRDRTDENE